MNKYLAGYVFAGETIFSIKTTGLATAPISIAAEPAPKPAAMATPPATALSAGTEPQKTPVKAAISQKRLLLVVNSLSSPEKELLAKIMQSVKQNIDDADIIDLSLIHI